MGGDPILIQDHFRFRDDDGSEAGATWHAALDTDVNDLFDGINYRIRISVQALNNPGQDEDIQFQYSHNEGAWTNITIISDYIRSIASVDVGFNHLDDTTQQITAGGFDGSDCCSETGICGGTDTDPPQDGHVETELCFLIVGEDLSPGDTIDIRVLFDGALDGWTEIPRITIPSAGVGAKSMYYHLMGVR